MFMNVIMTMITVANCLEPASNDKIDEDVKKVINKYISVIPDVEPQFVIHEGLSKVISHYFKDKISTFPLYKISLKLDRNPVKIPWASADLVNLRNPTSGNKNRKFKKIKRYQYVPQEKKQ